MTLDIQYFKEAGTLKFWIDGYDVCECTVENFNTVYSQTYRGLQTDVLPTAIRYIAPTATGMKICLEQKPQYQLVNFTPEQQEVLSANARSRFSYFLPLPWMMYVICLTRDMDIENVFGFVTNGPLTDPKDHMLNSIPMHNWYSDNSSNGAIRDTLCRPVYLDEDLRNPNPSIVSIVSQVYNEIWHSGFNNDLHDNVDYLFKLACDYKTLFSGLDRRKMAGLFKSNPKVFYEQFYRHWATLTIDQVVELTYRNSMLFTDMVSDCNLTGVKLINPNSFKTTVLTAAQNASMMV